MKLQSEDPESVSDIKLRNVFSADNTQNPRMYQRIRDANTAATSLTGLKLSSLKSKTKNSNKNKTISTFSKGLMTEDTSVLDIWEQLKNLKIDPKNTCFSPKFAQRKIFSPKINERVDLKVNKR